MKSLLTASRAGNALSRRPRVRLGSCRLLEYTEGGLGEIARPLPLFGLGFGFWHPRPSHEIPMNEHTKFKLTHYLCLTFFVPRFSEHS